MILVSAISYIVDSSHFHHRVHYKLSMACSPVGLISFMDRALSLVMAKVKVQFPVKPELFSGSFSTLELFI